MTTTPVQGYLPPTCVCGHTEAVITRIEVLGRALVAEVEAVNDTKEKR